MNFNMLVNKQYCIVVRILGIIFGTISGAFVGRFGVLLGHLGRLVAVSVRFFALGTYAEFRAFSESPRCASKAAQKGAGHASTTRRCTPARGSTECALVGRGVSEFQVCGKDRHF